MQLTQFTDYSLRVLMYLNDHPEGLCTIAEIAAYHKASQAHLVKVVHNLARLGYVESVRGKGGGIRLNKAPAEIIVGALVRETEPHFNIVECFDAKNNRCRISGGCGLQHVLHDATAQFMAVLDAHTLETITSQKTLSSLS